MDKFSDVLSNVRERLTNPFIFSLITSWLLCNWQITTALIMYDPVLIKSAGYRDLFDFINCNLTTANYWGPLLIAIGYTFLFPLFKVGVSAFNAFLSKTSNDLNIRILQNSKVPMDRYLDLRERYKEQSDRLEKVFKDEDDTLKNHSKMRAELDRERNEMNQLQNKLNSITDFERNVYNIKMLNGKWKLTSVNNLTREKKEDNFEIYDGIYIVNKNGSPQPVFKIQNFYYDNRTQFLFFVKLVVESGNTKAENFCITQLKVDKTVQGMVGAENFDTNVTYEKIK